MLFLFISLLGKHKQNIYYLFLKLFFTLYFLYILVMSELTVPFTC